MSEFIQGWRRLLEDHYGNMEVAKTIIGLLAIGLAYNLIQKTNINVMGYLTLPAIAIGFFANLLWPKKPSSLYGFQPRTRFILGWCAQIVVFGGLYAASILSINTYWPYVANTESVEQKLNITGKGSMTGETRGTREKRRVVFYVDIDGASKGFTFSNDYFQKMDSFHYLRIQSKKGALGFDRILSVEASPD